MTILFRTAAMTLTLTLIAGAASAGCSPACKSGQVCRYEAAGGTYECKPAPSSGVKGSLTTDFGTRINALKTSGFGK